MSCSASMKSLVARNDCARLYSAFALPPSFSSTCAAYQQWHLSSWVGGHFARHDAPGGDPLTMLGRQVSRFPKQVQSNTSLLWRGKPAVKKIC